MRQAGLSLLEQVLEARVRLFGGAEAGEHAHRPQLAAVQRGVDAARVGILAGQAQVVCVIQVGDIERGIQAVDGLGGGGDELLSGARAWTPASFAGSVFSHFSSDSRR